MWVTSHLPNLKNFDFSAITKIERDKINVWYAAYQKKIQGGASPTRVR